MKQNFLLKSFVLLIALLAGGISASAQDAYVQWVDMATGSSPEANKAGSASTAELIPNAGVISSETLKATSKTTIDNVDYQRYTGFGVDENTSLYFEYSFSVAEGYVFTPSKISVGWAPSGGKAIGFSVYAGTTAANLVKIGNLNHSSDKTYAVDDLTTFTALGENTNFTMIRLVPYGKASSIVLNSVKIEGNLVADSDTRDPSTFALTSDSEVTLWINETAQIKTENAAGTITYESDATDVVIVSETGLMTAKSEGTAVITINDSGSETVKGAETYVTVTVKEHKNTTTENVDGGNNVEVVLSYADDIDTNSAAIEGVATFSDFAGKGGVQDGNSKFTIDGKDYSAIKVSASRQFVITPAPGVEITQVLAYVTSNKDTGDQFKTYYDASGNTHNLETAIDIPDVGETPLELDLTAYYENGFRFEKQSRIVFKITYNKITQMTLEIKETGYATLFTDYAVAIPEGVEAFTGKYNAETQTVQLSAVTGTIPANTAVILHTETPGTYSFVKADDVAAITNNDLLGTLEEKDVNPQSVYTLGLGGADNTVGMRLYNGTTIRAYSAYMEIPTATIAPTAPFLSIGFGDEGTTGIRSIDNGQLTIDNVYYDLAGRRVAQPSKGVYIVNGKKVVIK